MQERNDGTNRLGTSKSNISIQQLTCDKSVDVLESKFTYLSMWAWIGVKKLFKCFQKLGQIFKSIWIVYQHLEKFPNLSGFFSETRTNFQTYSKFSPKFRQNFQTYKVILMSLCLQCAIDGKVPSYLILHVYLITYFD